MHTIGQYKRLSLAREEGDPTKWGAGSDSEVPDPDPDPDPAFSGTN